MIPKRLMKEGINFVILKQRDKIPVQPKWQQKTLAFDDAELKLHLEKGYNYGVRGGGVNKLIIVDFDDEEIQKKIVPKLPETFTVKTGKGGLHKYFFTNGVDSFKILNSEKDTLADVQAEGKQVVGPGSTHPNGKKYEIIENKEIAFVDYAELKAMLMVYDDTFQKEKPFFKKAGSFNDDLLQKLKRDVPMKDVLSHLGINTSKNPTECPFHSSKGGKCLGFTDEVAHCFHCEGSWNIFSIIMEKKRCGFKESLDYLAKEFGYEKELEESRKLITQIGKQIVSISDKRAIIRDFLKKSPLFYDKSKIWWIWDKEKYYWLVVDEVDILNSINANLNLNTINTKERTEIIEALKQESRLISPKIPDKEWIQFKNQIVDLRKMEIFEATPEYFITNPIPWELSENKETPNIDRIFTEWVGEDYKETLYQIIAYCLLPHYPIQRLFCLYGEGSNGKSKFLELIQRFVGKENITSSELDVLLSSRFEIAKLHKKLVCIMGETNFSELKKTSVLKRLTGQDLIGFEYKNKNPFQDYNYSKILIATNNIPPTSDKTIGFGRRWLIIDFPNSFSEQKEILDEIPKEEYNNLAWKSIGVLKELLKERKFHNEGTVTERILKYEEKSNPFDKFIKEKTEEAPDEYIAKYEFREVFEDWCAENHFRKVSDRGIGIKMKEMGYETLRIQADWHTSDGTRPRIWAFSGLRWRNSKMSSLSRLST